jgi:tetratricopeptide (TPR) repeat protein/O-antigen ligase
VLPLYFNPRSARVFEPDKLAWLVSLALVALAASLFTLAERPASRSGLRAALRRPLPLLGLLTALVMILGTVLGRVPSHSFWGAYLRGEGLLVMLALLTLFAATAATADRPEVRARFLQLLSLTTIPAATYALLQRFGFDSLQWDIYGSAPSERAFGPLGNPIFLGAWLAMVAPLAAAGLLVSIGAIRRGRSAAMLQAIGHGLALLLALAGLIASQSRGPLLGLLAGAGSFILLSALRHGRPRLALTTLGLGLGGVLVLAGLGRAGLGGRLGQVFSLSSRTARQRSLVWEALDGLLRADPLRALHGYGPESLAYVLPPHVSEALVQLTPEQYFDRAHNMLWEWWISAGLLGVLVLLALHVAAFDLGLRQLGLLGAGRRERLLQASFMLGAALMAGVMASLAGLPALAAPAVMGGLLVGAFVRPLLTMGKGTDEGEEGRIAARGRSRLERAEPGRSSQGRPGRRQRTHASSLDAGAKVFGADDEAWLCIGILSALVAHWVEAALGLPTASSDLLFWLGLGLLVAVPEARFAGARIAGARIAGAHSRTATENKAPPLSSAPGLSDGLLEGLVLACVVMAPVLLPSPQASRAAWPILLLIPLCWLAADFLGAGGRAGAGRPASRLSVAALLSLGLLALRNRPGGEVFAFALVLILTILSLAYLQSRAENPDASVPVWRWTPYLALTVLTAVAVWWLGLRPILADVWARQGQEAYARGAMSESAAKFERAIDLWPEQALFQTMLAAALEQEMLAPDKAELERVKSFEAARLALQRAWDMAPDDLLGSRLGKLYRSRGDLEPRGAGPWWEQAGQYFDAALALHPLSLPARFEQAGLFERQGRLAEARAGYLQVLRLDPSRLDASAGLVRTALDDGDFEAAAAAIDAAIEGQEGKTADLDSALAAATGIPDGGPSIDRARAMGYARSGRKPEALALLDAPGAGAKDEGIDAGLRAWIVASEGP